MISKTTINNTQELYKKFDEMKSDFNNWQKDVSKKTEK